MNVDELSITTDRSPKPSLYPCQPLAIGGATLSWPRPEGHGLAGQRSVSVGIWTPLPTAARRPKRPSTSPGGRSLASERACAPSLRSACGRPVAAWRHPAKQTARGDVRPATSRLPLRAVCQPLRAPLLAARARPAMDRKQRGAALGTVALPTGATVGQSNPVCVGNGDLLAADASTLRSGIGRS